MTPDPIHMSQIWWRYTPSAETRKPPPQQHAATAPAFRGPSRSSQAPNRAADDPRNTKNRVNIQPRVLIFQSQVVATSRSRKLMPSGQGTDRVIPTALLSGSQNTLNP